MSAPEFDTATRTELEAAAFRRLVGHLRERSDVQNIDMMNLAGFCRNCLSRWYREEAATKGITIADPDARTSQVSYTADPVHAAIDLERAARALRGQLQQVRCPTLIVHGALDRVCPVANAHVFYLVVDAAYRGEYSVYSYLAYLDAVLFMSLARDIAQAALDGKLHV